MFDPYIKQWRISDFQVVSCSGDGKIYYTDVYRPDTYSNNQFNCHFGTAYEVGTQMSIDLIHTVTTSSSVTLVQLMR